MQIQKSSSGDLLTLSVDGMLDNESASHCRDAIDEVIRAGWHRVVLDLSSVNYVSSAGIGVLLEARKKLEHLHGLFGVCNLTSSVEQIFHQTRVLKLLLCDPATLSKSASRGTRTLQLDTQLFSDGVAGYERYAPESTTPLRVEVIGRPEGIQSEVYTKQDCRRVPFPASTFGIGLGATGPDFDTAQNRFGEFIAVAGAAAQSSTTIRGLPDFLMSQEDFVAEVQTLYGVKCTGDFSDFIRFEAHRPEDAPLGWSGLVTQALSLTNAKAAGIVVLAECEGLVGTRLRKSPVTPVSAGGDRVHFPEVKQWLSYSAEPVYRRSLALIVGVAQIANQTTPLSKAREFLRPLTPSGELLGHFHAAVFPYRPLKKRTLELHPIVNDLFSSGSIQDVLHLLHDDRPVMGAGESTFVTGGCWVAPITAESTVEVLR